MTQLSELIYFKTIFVNGEMTTSHFFLIVLHTDKENRITVIYYLQEKFQEFVEFFHAIGLN
jgi:hypothetical protein